MRGFAFILIKDGSKKQGKAGGNVRIGNEPQSFVLVELCLNGIRGLRFLDLTLFDVKSYLDSINVSYKTSGKNVTAGWIQLNCPYCPDPSFHLGVSERNLFNCWRCGTKGDIFKLVMDLQGISYYTAIDRLAKYYLSDAKELRVDIQKRYDPNVLPEKEIIKDFPQPYLEYLQSRGFDQSIIDKYHLLPCGNLGKYKFRTIVPVIEDGKIVNFTAMAMMGQSIRYIHCPNEQAIIPMKECIYNIDSVKDSAVIMEGVTDVWKFGDGGVATFGIEYTSQQINVLAKKKLVRAFVMFDAEELAQRKANKLAAQLSSFVKDVEVLELKDGDPGSLSQDEIKKIKSDIFFLS